MLVSLAKTKVAVTTPATPPPTAKKDTHHSHHDSGGFKLLTDKKRDRDGVLEPAFK